MYGIIGLDSYAQLTVELFYEAATCGLYSSLLMGLLTSGAQVVVRFQRSFYNVFHPGSLDQEYRLVSPWKVKTTRVGTLT